MKEHYSKLEYMFCHSPINKTLNAEIKINQGTSEIIFTATKSMHNEIKDIHNAYISMTLESAAFFAANSLIEDVLVFTKSFEINYLKTTQSKKLKASAKFVEKSMGNYFIIVELTENKNLIARGKGVFRRSKTLLENIKNYN
tara:strand:+ start:2573 stop:2998 length:426 start_codon:yes stop_codon:yes gene_type:complete